MTETKNLKLKTYETATDGQELVARYIDDTSDNFQRIDEFCKTDTTLSVEGGIADAKTVGDNVSQLKEDLANIEDKFTGGELDSNGNLIIESELVVSSMWAESNGGIVFGDSYSSFCRTPLINVESNTSYAVGSLAGNYNVVEFDSNKMFIQGGQSRIFTTSENTKYVGLSFNNKNDLIGQKKFVFMKGTSRPTEYIEPTFTPIEIFGSDYVNNQYVDEKIQSAMESVVKLNLPNSFNLVVGDTFEIFWKGVVNCLNPSDFYIEVECAKGYPWRRSFEFRPTSSDVGTHSMKVSLYSQERKLLDEKEVSLIVKPKATNPTSEKVVLYVGDSLASKGYVPDELHNRLVNIDGLSNIAFIGDKESERNSVPYVGNGGWSWDQYNASMIDNKFMWITSTHDKTGVDQHSVYADSNGKQWKLETIEHGRIKIIRISSSGTLPSSGTLTWVSGGENNSDIIYTASEQASGNPFWNSDTSEIDFSDFVTKCGKSSLDYVYVLLGWNSTGVTETSLKTSVRTFIDNVRASYPNCKITLLGIQIPAMEGLANNYGAGSGVLSNYYLSMNHVFNLNRWYEEVSSEFENVTFANVSSQFDTEYNMQDGTRQVNARNTTRIPRQANGVHPAESGYYQIADVCYRDFTHKLQ